MTPQQIYEDLCKRRDMIQDELDQLDSHVHQHTNGALGEHPLVKTMVTINAQILKYSQILNKLNAPPKKRGVSIEEI